MYNNTGHVISYNLIEEIETEYALSITDKQAENHVVIPEVFDTDEDSSVGLMVVDNIDKLENTLAGAGKLCLKYFKDIEINVCLVLPHLYDCMV